MRLVGVEDHGIAMLQSAAKTSPGGVPAGIENTSACEQALATSVWGASNCRI